MTEKYQEQNILRFITCGSVDDGKSTLVGRMLYDAGLLSDDQLDSLKKSSGTSSSTNNPENIDFSLLTDGLQAEHEQGITIDVSYRFFGTKKRKFIIADCPGHTQYTRNMATAASNANLAIILVDATNGLTEQSKRHFFINYLFGIKDFIIVINKMDLVNFDEAVFSKTKNDFLEFLQTKTNDEKIKLTFLPISATSGDNIVKKSSKTPYYKGSSLLQILENTRIEKNLTNQDLAIGIKYVARPNSTFRGFKGKISSGEVSVGQKVRIFGKRTSSEVSAILVDQKNVKNAKSGEIVCISLKDEIDISSGDFLTSFSSTLSHSNKFNANMIWLDYEELKNNKKYIIKFYNNQASTVLINPKFTYDINNGEQQEVHDFKLNDIGNFDIEIDSNIAISNYEQNPELGSFILIDKISNFTVAAGMIKNANIAKDVSPVSENISYSQIDITNANRATIKNQHPRCIWLSGLSGSGKSTIANLLDKALYKTGKHSFILDGDNIRHGLNSDLGFSREDRSENIRRIGHVCKLMADAGLIVISAFISPSSKMRDFVRNQIFKNEQFIEVYIKADLETCKQRDPKNLYKKALEGKIKDFTGIDSKYDIPTNPEIILDTEKLSPEECVSQILDFIQ